MSSGWNYSKWGIGKWGEKIITATAADSVAVSDAIRKKPRRSVAEAALGLAETLRSKVMLSRGESLALADQIIKSIKSQLSDVVPLADHAIPRSLIQFVDALSLADGVLALTQALRGDSLDLADVLARQSSLVRSSTLDVADSLAGIGYGRTLADTAAVADSVALGVAAYRQSMLVLADNLAAAVSASRADTLALLDDIAAAVGRGAHSDAVALADSFAVAALLNINDYAGSSNRCPPLETWTLSGGAYIDEFGDLVLPAFGARAVSPLIIISRAPNWWFSADYYSSETKAGSTLGGYLQGSEYFNINGVAAYNTNNYAGNGNAGTYEVNGWHRKAWGYTAGNNIAFIRMNIQSHSTYSAPSYKVRNPKLAIQSDTVYTPYGILSELQAVADAQQASVSAVADALVRKVSKALADVAAIADGLRAEAGHALSDYGTTTDALTLVVRRTIGDVLAVADEVAAGVWAQRPLPGKWGQSTWGDAAWGDRGDGLALADNFSVSIGFGALAEDLVSLADHIFSRSDFVRELGDSLGVADAAGAKVEAARGNDAVLLGDGFTSKSGRVLNELVGLADELLRSVAAVAGETVSISDAVRAGISVKLAEAIALSDQGELLVLKSVSDLLNMTTDELVAVAIAARRGSVLSLADLLRARAQLPPADVQLVSDAIIVTLHLARQVESLMGVLDEARRSVGKALADILHLSDAAHFQMEAARNEAVAIADALGVSFGRPLPADSVGIIDELGLRAALGLSGSSTNVSDAIQGRTIRVLQQVFIGGVSVPVTGLRVQHGASDRVSSCSFAIHNPSAEVLALAQQRAEVRVYLVDGDGTDYFAGHIVGNPVRSRSSVATSLQITADDWTAEAQNVFVSEVFTADDGTLDEIIRFIWSKYYGHPIRLDLVVPTSQRASYLPFNYDNLFEATEKVAQLLGWSWYVEWDGSDLVLRFFPPIAAVTSVTLSVAGRNVAAGTARFGQSNEMANSVYVFGGNARSAPFTERIEADGQRSIYALGSKPYKGDDYPITVTVDGVPMSVGVLYLHDPADYDVLIDFQQKSLHFRDDNRPVKGAIIATTFCYEYPVVAHLTDGASIAAFGLIETQVTDGKIRDIRAARERGRSILRDKAWPTGFGSCEVFVPGLRAGSFITVDLPQYNAQGLYEICEIEKWVEASVVRRSVVLNMADNAASRIAERLRAFAQRIASLEASQRPDDIVVQRILRGPENLELTAVGVVAGAIDTDGQSSMPVSDAYTAVWRSSAAAKAYTLENVPVRDEARFKARPASHESMPVLERVSGGISFWGIAKWGENPWGFEEVS